MSLASIDQPELERFTRTFEELFYAADPVAMTSYYTGQAQLMGDGMTPIQGHDAIELFWRTAIDRAIAAAARRTIQLHESHWSGELGYALCTVTVEIPGRARRASWDTTVWRRGADGKWRIEVDISCPLPPGPSAGKLSIVGRVTSQAAWPLFPKS
jgi:ketosteroid isomerase-like protein